MYYKEEDGCSLLTAQWYSAGSNTAELLPVCFDLQCFIPALALLIYSKYDLYFDYIAIYRDNNRRRPKLYIHDFTKFIPPELA